ncbi:hypothetical protein D3C85_1617970 [compost metagenome]
MPEPGSEKSLKTFGKPSQTFIALKFAKGGATKLICIASETTVHVPLFVDVKVNTTLPAETSAVVGL